MDRFEAFALLFDPSTFRHLDGLGLEAGWRVWEVGAGGTSVLDHLSARVGPTGHVLATDLNVSWAAALAVANVEVLEHDVADAPPPGAPFDLVHARLVLVHVPERDVALAHMVRSLRPGGILLVEDADPALQPLSCLEEIGPAQVLANRIRRGFRTLLAERGVDLSYGRTLPAASARRRPGRRGRRRRLPRDPPGLQRARDGDHQPDPGAVAGPRDRHRERDRRAPRQRGGRSARPDPAPDDLLLGAHESRLSPTRRNRHSILVE